MPDHTQPTSMPRVPLYDPQRYELLEIEDCDGMELHWVVDRTDHRTGAFVRRYGR